MLAGYGVACLGGAMAYPAKSLVKPPKSYVVNLYTMSQRTGSVSYLTFAAGFSLAVYAMFVVLCERLNFKLALFRIFGQNASGRLHHPRNGRDAGQALCARGRSSVVHGCRIQRVFAICVLFNRHLEKENLFLKL